MLKSFIPVPANSDFPLENIPFGIFKSKSGNRTGACTIIGDTIIDLYTLWDLGLGEGFATEDKALLNQTTLNDFIAKGKGFTGAVRKKIQTFFSDRPIEDSLMKDLQEHVFHTQDAVEMLLPVHIGDYTDFYSSRQHATNVGMMFRDPANALLPNWLHLPVGYHGRSSSINVSGTPIRRPKGQMLPQGENIPVFGNSKLLDFELEVAFVVGKANEQGQTVSTAEAEDYIFGLLLFNDWSARDLQSWEYVPLGPFLGKNFGSTVSPWIVTLEALDPFRMEGPVQDPPVLPYLQYTGKGHYDIQLEVDIVPENGQSKTVCRSNFKFMYWNMIQQLAHHTINGCNMRVGDVCASGTISGNDESAFGSMLELSWRGTKPIPMPDGSERKFINDGDTVVMRGFGVTKEGLRIGFGSVSSKVLPAV